MTNHLKTLRKASGMTLEALAAAIGTDRGTLSKLENGHRRMTVDWMIKLAGPLGVEPKEFLAPERPPPSPLPQAALDTVPVRAAAAGQNADIELTDAIIEWVPRPRSLTGVPDAYAVHIVNSSMEPRYMPGWIAYIHPDKPVGIGNDVIVFLRDGTCLIKTITHLDSGRLTLSSFNPAYPPIFLERQDYVRLHRVLFGLPKDAI
ncbi:XRE family transcriptional regulator [Lacibacterium aquatile]|uniref:XRE family transcriptional regulator n=1 Tax=Lacibacterium aquatile TaxID=1168082 RepID=A0ABW5DU72_9PROT